MMNDLPHRSGQTSVADSGIQSPVCGAIPLDLLFVGDAHPCPYLPGRQAMEEVFLAFEFPPELYHDFMDCGFRRSGDLFHRPICENCRECRAIRVPDFGFSDFQIPEAGPKKEPGSNGNDEGAPLDRREIQDLSRLFGVSAQFRSGRLPGRIPKSSLRIPGDDTGIRVSPGGPPRGGFHCGCLLQISVQRVCVF